MKSSLLPPGTPALPKAVAQACADVFNIDMPHRDVTSIEHCPEDLLPWLAWEYAVDAYLDSMSVEQKRRAIGNAVEIHRKKGTALAVRQALYLLGADITITEWWQTHPKGTPHTFTVEYSITDSSLPNTIAFQRHLEKAIERVKPLHAHYQLRTTLTGNTTVGAVATVRAVSLTQLTFTDN